MRTDRSYRFARFIITRVFEKESRKTSKSQISDSQSKVRTFALSRTDVLRSRKFPVRLPLAIF